MKVSIHKKQKWMIKGLAAILILSGYLLIWQWFTIKELNKDKAGLNTRLETIETFMKNVKDSLGGPGESIYEKTKYKDIFKKAERETDDYLYLKNMSEYQKQLIYEQHGKIYKLRYDWMINPVPSAYSPLRACEFGTPRMDKDGNVYAHTGWDIKSLTTTELQAPCDAVVSDVGFNEIGGYYIILKTIKQELNLKTNKIEDILYENYLGHVTGDVVVKKDQEVKQGDYIGIMGSTGSSAKGIHCHWSINRNGVLMNPVINTTYGNKIVEKIYKPYYNY